MSFSTVVSEAIDTGLSYRGLVTGVPGVDQFTVKFLSSIEGLAPGIFDGPTNPYIVFVQRKGTGTGLAPQGQTQPITAYVPVSSTVGTFTAPGFLPAVAIGDEVMIVVGFATGTSGGSPVPKLYIGNHTVAVNASEDNDVVVTGNLNINPGVTYTVKGYLQVYGDVTGQGTLSCLEFECGGNVDNTGAAAFTVNGDAQVAGDFKNDTSTTDIKGKFRVDGTYTNGAGSAVWKEWQEFDGVYVDPVNGEVGVGPGVGNPERPSSNLTDALLIAVARKVTRFYIMNLTAGDISQPSDYAQPYEFFGQGTQYYSSYKFNGKNPFGSVFNKLVLIGIAATDTVEAYDCDISLTGSVWAKDSVIMGGTYPFLSLYNCNFDKNTKIKGSGIIQWIFNNVHGDVEIQNFTAGQADIYGSDLNITVDATCSGGVINIYGDTKITDNHTGTCAVNDYTNKPKAEVPVNITAILGGETDFLNLATAGFHYTVDDLVLKSDDPVVPNTVIVRLKKLVNGFLTTVESFTINTANSPTYFDLMDMFGKPLIAGDQIVITVQQQVGGGPTVVTGSYSARSA